MMAECVCAIFHNCHTFVWRTLREENDPIQHPKRGTYENELPDTLLPQLGKSSVNDTDV